LNEFVVYILAKGIILKKQTHWKTRRRKLWCL